MRISAPSGCFKRFRTPDGKHVHQETAKYSGERGDRAANLGFVSVDGGHYRRGATVANMVGPGGPTRAGG